MNSSGRSKMQQMLARSSCSGRGGAVQVGLEARRSLTEFLNTHIASRWAPRLG